MGGLLSIPVDHLFVRSRDYNSGRRRLQSVSDIGIHKFSYLGFSVNPARKSTGTRFVSFAVRFAHGCRRSQIELLSLWTTTRQIQRA